MDEATALASVRVMLGHSDGTNDVASVVTVRIVPNLPFPPPPPYAYAPEPRPFPKPASSRLEYVLLMSVRLLDAIDWFVVESAIDTRVDCLKGDDSDDGDTRGGSPAPEEAAAATRGKGKGERSDGRERRGERGGRMGGTSSRSLVLVGVSWPSVSSAAVAASLDKEVASGLTGRNVGTPTESGGVHRLVLAVRVRGEEGDRGVGGGGCGDEDCAADRLGEDMTARGEEPVWYGELGPGFEKDGDVVVVLMGLRLLPLPRRM
jgi:hypothetical protein